MRAFRIIPVVAFVALLSLVAGTVLTTGPQAFAAASLTEGSLTWGVKQSWRNYAGFPIMSAGVTQRASGEFDFPLESGTFDDETGTTTVSFSGAVQWQSHWYPDEAGLYPPPSGYTGPLDIHVLDVTLSDPQITISPDEAVLTANAVSRRLDTWDLVDHGRVPVVTLDVAQVAPATAGGETTWADVPAAFTSVAAQDVFGGFYSTGMLVDDVTFTYRGDGGAPTYDEQWTVPGSTGVRYDANGLVSDQTLPNWNVWWVDHDDRIVHYTVTSGSGASAQRTFQAYDLQTLQPVGDPYVITGSSAARLAPSNWSFIDPDLNRVYYRSANSGSTVDSYIDWDPEGRAYVAGTLAAPLTLPAGVTTKLLWDSEHHRALAVRRVDSGTNFDDSTWYLTTFTRQPDGRFVEATTPLPSGPVGWNRNWYRMSDLGSAVASDGSLILTRHPRGNLANVPGSGEPFPGEVLVQRITSVGEGVAVDEVPGTDLEARTGLQQFEQVLTNDSGRVVLTTPAPAQTARGYVAELQIADGSIAAVSTPLDLGDRRVTSYAIDPLEGTVWAQSAPTRSLVAVKDGSIVFEGSFPLLHPDRAFVVVDGEHNVYALSNDGADPDIGAQFRYGFARLVWLGYSPTVTAQPEPVSVMAGTTAEFAYSAMGTPSPTVQWQERVPGSIRFVDLEGETAPTLAVHATADRNGTEYRAVLRNTAGSVATDAATLEVLTPPVVTAQPADVAARVGDTALIQVLSSGNPEPSVTWQSTTGGDWVDLAASDDVVIEGGNLTLENLTAAQDGTRVRAKLVNTAGTTYSDEAVLTVSDVPSEPGEDEQEIVVDVPDLGPGEFVWSIPGSERTVALGTGEDRGDHWYATGELLPVTVADTRTGGPVWSISGQVGDFTGGLPGRYLGWTPTVVTSGAGAVSGDPVASGFVSGDGLSSSAVLAGAPDGHEPGSATLGAALDLRMPKATPAGSYTATLTITALS